MATYFMDRMIQQKRPFQADEQSGNLCLLARRPYDYYRQNSSKSQTVFQTGPQQGIGSRLFLLLQSRLGHLYQPPQHDWQAGQALVKYNSPHQSRRVSLAKRI